MNKSLAAFISHELIFYCASKSGVDDRLLGDFGESDPDRRQLVVVIFVTCSQKLEEVPGHGLAFTIVVGGQN